MSSTISLPNPLYERLASRSKQLKRTPEEVVTDLVQQYLAEPGNRWQAEFSALIARIQAKTAAFSADEIESDITQAAAEARKLRRAHHTG